MDAAAEAVERELIALVRRARTRGNRAARELDARLDGSAYAALARVADGGPLRAKSLACQLGLDKSTVSRMLTTLTELGLIDRIPDPSDGRASLIRLTATGRDRVDAVRTKRRAELQALLAAWPAEDQETFARLLAAFNVADSEAGTTQQKTPDQKEVSTPNVPADGHELIS
ncbi:MarR family winged helix-turn-helix transcriptional regulator [Flindersiella endophytica]